MAASSLSTVTRRSFCSSRASQTLVQGDGCVHRLVSYRIAQRPCGSASSSQAPSGSPGDARTYADNDWPMLGTGSDGSEFCLGLSVGTGVSVGGTAVGDGRGVDVGDDVAVADGVGARVTLPCAMALANSSRACCVASGGVRV